MTNKLKNYFPMIQERQEILTRIQADRSLHARFINWPSAQQEDFLDICTGVKGLRLLYDGFFKEVMNPEYVPGRLNDFLSHMLGQEVRILKVLPNDSTRLADESSLLKYLFIPLDIFRKSQQNRTISNKKDAWLPLFSCDDPDTIAELTRANPEFMEIYEEAYTICLNIERVMEMFSEELAILDRNTAKYMMDEMQNEIDAMHDKLKEQKREFEEQQSKLNEQRNKLNEQQDTIDQMKEKYAESLRNTIALLRSLAVPESEITVRICEQYQMDEAQLRQYL